MATPAFDLNRFTVESVANVGDASKEFTKPAGARSMMVYAAEAYWLYGGDQAAGNSSTGSQVDITPGATLAMPFAAGTLSPALPCGGMVNIQIAAQTGNLSNVAIIWMF